MGVNKDLGLPFGDGMQKVAICFDVDGTLIDKDYSERAAVTTALVSVHKLFKNAKIVVWSGGGAQYAETHIRALDMEHLVWKYMSKLQHQELRDAGYIILAIDDVQDTRLGDINLIVRQ